MSIVPRTNLPWIDWDEWIAVKNALYPVDTSSSSSSSSSSSTTTSSSSSSSSTTTTSSSTPNNTNIIWALEIISLWRSRGKLPHSCDSTAQLVEISNRDCNSNNNNYRSENELRIAYSLTVVRGINGLVDQNQQGVFADSVLGLAARIGIPGWIVELRHEATHNKLPSLSLLRAAARHLITWYYDNYWTPQYNHIQTMMLSCIQLVPSSLLSSSSVNNYVTDSTSFLSPTFITEILIPSFIDAEIINKV